MPEIARLAFSAEWTMAAGIDALAGGDPAEAIASYESTLAPLATYPLAAGVDGVFPRPMRDVRDWLKPIGMKIAPTMSGEQCSAWLTAVALALSDFPPRVIVSAARSAIRIPMSFLNEVDGHVRAEAEKIMARHRLALRRLREMRAELARAASSGPTLTAPEPEYRPSASELRSLPIYLRKLGLAGGWITQDQLDAADAVEDSR